MVLILINWTETIIYSIETLSLQESLWFCCFFTLPLLSAHGSQITRSQNDIINLLLPGNGTIKYLDSRLFFSGFFHLCAEWENPPALPYLHIQLAFP